MGRTLQTINELRLENREQRDLIESQAARIAELEGERSQMLSDMADAVRSACERDTGEVEKTLVPWCHHILYPEQYAARKVTNDE